MKANRSIRSDRAEVGVGTLIVFIAMVLVAAVAAAVLINTTGTLQQRAQATGKEATQEVSSNLKVVNVYGIVVSSKIEDLIVNVQLSAGALPLDLEKAIVRFSDGTSASTFNYNWTHAYKDTATMTNCDGAATLIDPGAGTHLETSFVARWQRPTVTASNDLGCSGTSVMNAGDLVELRFTLAAARGLNVREQAYISIIPEIGSAVQADFTTPATYGSDTYVTLR